MVIGIKHFSSAVSFLLLFSGYLAKRNNMMSLTSLNPQIIANNCMSSSISSFINHNVASTKLVLCDSLEKVVATAIER